MDLAAQQAYDAGDYSENAGYSPMGDKDNTAGSGEAGNGEIVVENRFGTFAFTKDRILTFANGLVGFGEFTEFALAPLPNANDENNFLLLQSLQSADLAFIVYPTTIKNSLLREEDLKDIAETYQVSGDNMALLHIATIREGGAGGDYEMSLNIRAPIIIDVSDQNAVQHVLSSNKYPVQYKLGSEGQASASEAGADDGQGAGE